MHDPIVQATPAETSPTSTVNPHTKSSISEREAATMTGWIKQDLASGKMTQAQADQAFAELNTSLEQRGPDTRTDEQKTLDQHFGPPAKPEDYRITYEDVPMTPELKQFDTNSRTWMASAGMPKNIGDSLVATIAKVAQQTQRMTEGEIEAYGHKEFEKLHRVHGEKLEERLQAAGRMVHELEIQRPGLKNLLNSRGIGDNAMVANMLITHAQIFHARKGR